MITIEYALTGIIAGFAAGYLGIGGGLILVPALTWLFSTNPATSHMPVHFAVATSLSTMLITSASSIIAHHRRGAILWPLTGRLSPGLIGGAIVGALLAVRLSTGMLAVVFGAYAALAGVQLIRGREATGRKPLPGLPGSTLVGGLIGTISSLVGIGGGSLTVPWLLWHGRNVKQAVATAAACGYPIAVAGTASFMLLGQQRSAPESWTGFVHVPAFAGIALFSVVAAPLGAAVMHRSPPGVVRRIFGGFMLIVAWKMMF